MSTTFSVNVSIGKKQWFVCTRLFLERPTFMSRTPFARVPVNMLLWVTQEQVLTKLLVNVSSMFNLTDLDTRPVSLKVRTFSKSESYESADGADTDSECSV